MGWLDVLLAVVVVALALYTVIPDLFLHRLGVGSWKRQYTPGVAITFDDGPDPTTTPQILDILDRYQLAATFFVVGERAVRYPELLREMRQRGHVIGAHSMEHRYAWFMSPYRTWREWDKAVATLEGILGESIYWVRPPWGTFNLATWLWLQRRRKRAVLWNVEGHDWQAQNNWQRITQRVLQRVSDGSIVVLHDAGGDKGAPQNTVQALDHILRGVLQEKKRPLVALQFPEWSGWRRLKYTLWGMWEHLFAKLYHVEYVAADNMIRLARTRYQGPDLYEDGQLLAKTGDWVCEIHFDSMRLQGEGETDAQKLALRAIRQTKQSLPGMARYVQTQSAYQDVQVFIGITMLHRGVKGFGFQIEDLPITLGNRLVGVLQKSIMNEYHSAGKHRPGKSVGNQPKLVWISRKNLLERWLPQEA